MPSERPYSVPAASAATSSTEENGVTGATGPKISCWYAGACTGTSPSTVGR
jgi:hypothetical protein